MVILWDLATGKEIRTLTGHAAGIHGVAFSPDGRSALSGSRDKTLKLWNLDTGKEIRTLAGHTTEVYSCAISPDGRSALSGGDGDLGELKLWDLATGKEIRTFTGHTSFVRSVAFSPDGRSVLSCGEDKTLKLWNVATGKEIRTLFGHTAWVWTAAFSPNGRSALSGSMEIKLWDFSRAPLYLDFEAKVSVAQATLQKSPDDAAALAVLGEWWAFRGRNDWAVELLERARAGGTAINPLTLGRCYWELSDDLPQGSKLTRADCLAAAAWEFNSALTASHNAAEKFHLQLCLSAVQVAATQPAIPVSATQPAATAPPAQLKEVRDDRGHVIEQRYLGADDRLVLNANGWAKATQTYDDRGKLIERACFGVDGKPVLNRYGWTKVKQVFDGQGTIIRTDYFGIDGQPLPMEVVIETCAEGYQAAQIGLRPGDVILQYGDKTITTTAQMQQEASLTKDSKTPVRLQFRRDGTILSFETIGGDLGITCADYVARSPENSSATQP